MHNLVMAFSTKVECVPHLTTKLGWLVKIKSIQKLELDSMSVGSDMPVDKTNISFTILQENFTNDTLSEVL